MALRILVFRPLPASRPPQAISQTFRKNLRMNQTQRSHAGNAECLMLVIGLVGNVAGGKSTVARRLSVLGAGWIDADRLAHRCLRLRAVRDALVHRFGPQLLDNSGQVDRSRLAEAVFGGDSLEPLRFVESLLHPAAFDLAVRRLRHFVHEARPAVVIDAPLLLEAGWDRVCDCVWCVEAPLSQRLGRVAVRGWSAEELQERERRQWDLVRKSERSTVVIHNRGDRADLIKQVDDLWDFLQTSPRRNG